MNERTEYGQLVREAGKHILAANVALERQLFANGEVALGAVTAYRDLLHALNRHGHQLAGAFPDSRSPSGAAERLVEELARIGQRDYGAGPRSGVIGSWAAAASSVRSATDLLATHRDRYGGRRSPEAVLLDDVEVRAAGFGELAALTIPAASVANSLGLRMGEAGMAWPDVAALVPETGPLLDVALETRRLGGLFGPPLSTMNVARPAVRSEDPVVELGDRLARLHRVAWQLTQMDRVGVCTLADLAVAGIVVNEHAARLMRHLAPDLDSRRGSARFEKGATAWRRVHQQIRQLRTTTPALPGLRADIVSVRQLLDQLVGADGSRRLQATVVGGARAFADVAVWNSQVLDHLARRGDLFVPGRFLTGNEVSDHPTLVVAKLKGFLAPMPKQHLEPLHEAYDAARAAGTAEAATLQQQIPLEHESPVLQS